MVFRCATVPCRELVPVDGLDAAELGLVPHTVMASRPRMALSDAGDYTGTLAMYSFGSDEVGGSSSHELMAWAGRGVGGRSH